MNTTYRTSGESSSAEHASLEHGCPRPRRIEEIWPELPRVGAHTPEAEPTERTRAEREDEPGRRTAGADPQPRAPGHSNAKAGKETGSRTSSDREKQESGREGNDGGGDKTTAQTATLYTSKTGTNGHADEAIVLPSAAENADSGPVEGNSTASEECATSDSKSGECATLSGNRGLPWNPGSRIPYLKCERTTREAIFEYIPAARDSDVLFRYIIYVLFAPFYDDTNRDHYYGDHYIPGYPIISRGVCQWVWGSTLYAKINAGDVIQYLQYQLPLKIEDWIPGKRCRLIVEDGIPEKLWKITRKDRPDQLMDPVYVLSGHAYDSHKDPSEERKRIRKELGDMLAPSDTAAYIWERMNNRPSNHYKKIQDHLLEAQNAVDEMELEVDLKHNRFETKADYEARTRRREEKLRDYYHRILAAIRDQPQPFYAFSRAGRTDRIYPFNISLLSLPKEVREILTQDFWEVDLSAAQLKIAAWYWDAYDVLDWLEDGYDVWNELIGHFEQELGALEKGSDRYAEVKAALKTAMYSTVFGKDDPHIRGSFTRMMSDIIGSHAGTKLREHWLIGRLIEKRDEKLSAIEMGDRLDGPTGITVTVEVPLSAKADERKDKVCPRSAMATIMQSYEQELMKTVLKYEESRPPHCRFRVVAWIHDGCYVHFRGSGRARLKELNTLLRERCRELTERAGKNRVLPASFDKEKLA